MKNLILIFSFLSISPSSFSYFYKLECEAWHQESGQQLSKAVMITITYDHKERLYKEELNGFSYEVKWDVNLDTFYKTIKKGNQRVLFSTARVPSFEHNDSFTDLTLLDGTRLAISCGFKPKK